MCLAQFWKLHTNSSCQSCGVTGHRGRVWVCQRTNGHVSNIRQGSFISCLACQTVQHQAKKVKSWDHLSRLTESGCQSWDHVRVQLHFSSVLPWFVRLFNPGKKVGVWFLFGAECRQASEPPFTVAMATRMGSKDGELSCRRPINSLKVLHRLEV